jgi:rhodanese-related sulfurtransferase
VAFFLRKNDYEANAIKGGLKAWKEADYPIEEKDE